MEQFIIFLIIWLLIALANAITRSREKKKSAPTTKTKPSAAPTAPEREPAEIEIPPFLREILGMDEPEPMPPPPAGRMERKVEEAEEPLLPPQPLSRKLPVTPPEEGIPEKPESLVMRRMADLGSYPEEFVQPSGVPPEIYQKEALKRAILLKEILGEPVSRRMIPGPKIVRF